MEYWEGYITPYPPQNFNRLFKSPRDLTSRKTNSLPLKIQINNLQLLSPILQTQSYEVN